MAATAVAAPSAGGPPATPKQYETIQRFERTLRIPKDRRANPDGLTRAQASEIIADYIAQMNPDPEDEQETQQRIAQAVTQTAPQTQQRDVAQGEWPPVPAQSSEATDGIQTGDDEPWGTPEEAARARQAAQATPQANRQAPAPRQQDDPFAPPADESWEELGATPLGAEDDEIDLERAKLAPVGQNLGFVVISADKKAPGQSGYAGILITAKHIAGGEGGEAELGGTATEFLSLSPNARWKMDEFLDACNAPPTGKINYRQFVGWTFWASTKRDDYTRTLDDGTEQVTPKVVIDKHLQGPKIVVPKQFSVNGTATPAKPVARLGAEFSDANPPF